MKALVPVKTGLRRGLLLGAEVFSGEDERHTCQITEAAAETGANGSKTDHAAQIIAIVLKMDGGSEAHWHLSVV